MTGSLALGGALLVAHFGAAALCAQDTDKPPADDPPRLVDQVTVTASRSDTRLGDAPVSVAVLPQEAVAVTAAPTVDDALRQVVGFSLFRRTGSLAANPTVQGVSLRGLGASGASRSLVLLDGLPLNDPFGGWVYWGRVPRIALQRLEVLRGGSSDLYGSGALGGVAQILTRRPGAEGGFEAEASAGGSGFLDGGLTAHGTRGAWGGRLSTEVLTTDGYLAVAEDDRGAVDEPVASHHTALDATVERRMGEGGRFYFRGMYYDEARDNGTRLQRNDTWIGLAAVGVDSGPWSLRAWGSTQELNQTFSAIASDRDEESLVRSQSVPADALGVSTQWAGAVGRRHHLVAGFDGRHVQGTTRETGHFAGEPTSRLEAGGSQRSAGLFLADRWQAHTRFLLSTALRLDVWSQRDGRSITMPLRGDSPSQQTLHPDRTDTAWSPRLGLLFRASSVLSFTGSAYGAFRGPTLNELYRGFRVGNVVTRANAALKAERLWGGEVGVLVSRRPFAMRLTVFDAAVRDAVANVTLETTDSLVTRQRQNVARARSTGLEVEGEVRLGRRGVVSAGYTLIDSRVTDFPPDVSLEGRSLPHIPRHQTVLQVRYESDWRFGLQARWIGEAWENDLNTLALDSAFVLDVFVARRITGWLEAFASGENLLDADVVVRRTPVRGLGIPRTLRGGVRFRAGRN